MEMDYGLVIVVVFKVFDMVGEIFVFVCKLCNVMVSIFSDVILLCLEWDIICEILVEYIDVVMIVIGVFGGCF